MNNREVFEKVKAHLLTQGKRSMGPRNDETNTIRCAYRGDNGAMCAIGCLIPDELYSPTLEGHDSSHCDIRTVLAKAGFESIDKSMLSVLQRMHDGYSPDMWTIELDRIEARYL